MPFLINYGENEVGFSDEKPGANTGREAVEAIEKNFDLRFSCYHLEEG